LYPLMNPARPIIIPRLEDIMAGLSSLADAANAEVRLKEQDEEEEEEGEGLRKLGVANPRLMLLNDSEQEQDRKKGSPTSTTKSRRRRRTRSRDLDVDVATTASSSYPMNQSSTTDSSSRSSPLEHMDKTSSLSSLRSGATSLSPPPRRDNSLNSLLREGRPHLGRSSSETAATTAAAHIKSSTKGVRFAADANGELIKTIHEIPYLPPAPPPLPLISSPAGRRGGGSSSSNRGKKSKPSASPATTLQIPSAWNQHQVLHLKQSSSAAVHTTRPAFSEDSPPSRSKRREKRFQADPGRDSAPMIMPRRGMRQESEGRENPTSSNNNNTEGQQQQEQEADES